MATRTLSNLPARNRGTYLDRCQKLNLTTNLYKVDFKDSLKVYIYALKTTPDIPRENGKRMVTLVASARNAIQAQVGMYVTSGRTIFASKIQGSGKEEIIVKAELEGTFYQIHLRMVKEVAFSEILHPQKEKSAIAFSFLNNMIRNFFRQTNFTEIGRSRKFFDATSQRRLNGANVTVYKGFSTNFQLLENGLFLKADPIMKIIRSESVLDVINNVYKKNQSVSRNEKRLLVQQELIGKMVMADYGKNKCYIIETVLFDVTLESHQFNYQGHPVNILEYYSQCYGIAIQSKKQPLLKAKSNRKCKDKQKEKENEVILVPQLCLMSGLPDDFDERKRRQVSEVTITNPAAKLNDIQTMFKALSSTQSEFNPKALAQKLGIKLSETPHSITAKQMQFPELMLGQKGKVEDNKATNFMLFNKPLFNRDVSLKICIILPQNFQFSPIKKLLQSTASNLGLSYRQQINTINFSDNKMAMRNIQNIVRDESQSKTSNIFWFIIPPNYKTQYKNFKAMVLKNGVELNSQITVCTNLEKKGFQSIFTKILLQMAAKVGNKLWVPRISSKVQSLGVMLLGIETTKDSQDHSKNIISYCANSSRDFSSFYSNYFYVGKGQLKTNMKEILFNSINEYVSKCNTPPGEILIVKNGTTKLDVGLYVQTQLNEIKEVLKCFGKTHEVRLTYIVLDKNSSQKFFVDKGRDVVNPYSGTIVNSDAVGKNFQFYLIAQQCNRGTVKPTYYRVAYSDSCLEEGVIEELIYSQCFNYMNWTGSIKVPGVLQYAKKLGAFIGEHYNKETKFETLSKTLYYI